VLLDLLIQFAQEGIQPLLGRVKHHSHAKLHARKR
jgi:hypothetical protein